MLQRYDHLSVMSTSPSLIGPAVLSTFAKLGIVSPFKLSIQAAEFLNNIAEELQSHFKSLLSVEKFRFVVLADSSSTTYFGKTDDTIRAKTIGLEIRPAEQRDFFTIPSDKYQEIKSKGLELADKLGMRLIEADFFLESFPPDCGKVYEIKKLNRSSLNGDKKIAFALAAIEDCVIGSGEAARISTNFNDTLHGRNPEELREKIRLINEFRNELLQAELQPMNA